jgi:II/X family phage/plasmid replication protein
VLIDFITAWVDLALFSEGDQAVLRSQGDRISKWNPRTGEVSWEVSTWDSVRSDSHQISIRVASDRLWCKGSPARVIGDGDAAFGAGPARALDLRGCVERMASFVCARLEVSVPAVQRWQLTRVDITSMSLTPSLATVRQALSILRNCEGGRYRVSQQAGDTVYWSHHSRLKAGKAYAKGPHLRQAQQKPGYGGRRYTKAELVAVDRCLRLELTLGSQFWRERVGMPWYELTKKQHLEWHAEYFNRMLGNVEVTEMSIETLVQAVAPSKGQAKAAIGTWALIKSYGWEKAREMTSLRTWYRNLRILRDAGLSDADLSAGAVVALRRPLLQCQQVESWEELMAAVYRRAA